MFLESHRDEKALVIVAPASLRKAILAEKIGSYPLLDLKILSKGNLLRGLAFDFDLLAVKEASDFLKTSYAIAQEFLSLLPVVSLAHKGIPERFASLLDHLEGKGLLYRRPYFKNLLQNKKVLVFAYSSCDRELSLLFERAGVTPIFEKMALNKEETTVHSYFDEKREAVALFERIWNDIESGDVATPSSVNLLVGPGYEKEIRRLSRRYGLPVNGLDEATLSSFPFYKSFYAYLEEGKAVDEAFAAIGNPVSNVYGERKALASLLSEIAPLSTGDRAAYLQLLEYGAGRTKVQPHPYKDGINLIHFDEAVPYLDHLYVIGFNAPAFPPASKDDGLLSTAEKEAMGLNTALIENAMASETVWALLRSGGVRYISLIDKNPPGKDEKPPFRPHVIEKEPVRERAILREDENGVPFSHSKEETIFLSARAKDNLRLYREQSKEESYYSDAEIGYRQYDNSFTGVSFPLKMPLSLSYSSLDKYSNCPFRFYLDEFLLHSNDEYSFASAFGTLFHFAIQIEHAGTIDWKAVADRADELFAGRCLDRSIALEKVKYAEIVAQKHDEFLANSGFGKTVKREEGVLVSVSEDLRIKGTIDEACLGKEKLLIVDFKTGSVSFSYSEALKKRDLQLPTYLLLAAEHFPKYQPVGAFIVSVKGFGRGSDHPFKLDGIFLDEQETMALLDPKLLPGSSSSYVEGLKRKKGGDYGQSSKRIGALDFQKLSETALEAFKEVANEVKALAFPIAPRRIKGRTPCSLCGLRDVCFLKDEQIVEEESEGNEETEGGIEG